MGAPRWPSDLVDAAARLITAQTDPGLAGVDLLETVQKRERCTGEIERRVGERLIIAVERNPRQCGQMLAVVWKQHVFARGHGSLESGIARQLKVARAKRSANHRAGCCRGIRSRKPAMRVSPDTIWAWGRPG